DAMSLEAVTVNAYRPAETIGGSTKTDTPLREVPQSVSVIERREMDLRGVRNLNEATRYTAGVLPESQGIDNRVDDLYIRGFDAGRFGTNVVLGGLRARLRRSLVQAFQVGQPTFLTTVHSPATAARPGRPCSRCRRW
ncbi:TonB-dependent receptor plug domain-containing protein, partial [Bordetella petrii]|uniref:TonB-dependent receptor plug domain-containing protein n=1 Tax=Bordetella petrii TaxID=94624 RepID=UPI001E2B7F1A